MTILCFSGPSLAPRMAQQLFPEALCCGPAAQGDVYSACVRYRARAVCLIDGYFEHRPSVSHKELLWALSNGIAVFGAASIGALRAIELAPFGMIGEGGVVQLYATRAIENDDEVAVIHANSDRDYRVQSDALVNIRCSLELACARGVLSPHSRDLLVDAALRTFYPERSYERLLCDSATQITPGEHEALFEWLAAPEHRIDLKRDDAARLLLRVRDLYQTDRLPVPSVSFEFPETDAWLAIRRAADERAREEAVPGLATNAELIEEAQLAGPSIYEEVIRAATWRTLCLALRARDIQPVPDPGPAQVDVNATIDAVGPIAFRRVLSEVEGALVVLGLHDQFATRAVAKREWRARAHLAPNESNEGEIDRLLQRYFQDRLGRSAPQAIDQYAESIGFADAAALVQAIWVDDAYTQSRQS